MSALPKQIQAQLDQADALQAEMDAAAAPQEGNPEAAPAATQPNLQLVEPPEQGAQVAQPEYAVLEQRFRVMEGKYKAEVPRLIEQNRTLTEQLDRALAALDTKAKETPPETKLVTDADIEAYGDDLVDMVRRAAREEFKALSEAFSAKLDQRFGDVAAKADRAEKQAVKSETDKFWDAVNAAHPDFDAVNVDARWDAFLDTNVPGTRFTRRAVANDALNRFDAGVVVEQLTAFKDSIGVGKTTPTRVKPNLNSQVAPSSSRSSTPQAEGASRIWTGKEYADALDHRNGQRMERAEYEALIAEAETALAEGRVRF